MTTSDRFSWSEDDVEFSPSLEEVMMDSLRARVIRQLQGLGVEIEEEHLGLADDDCWVYSDYTGQAVYTLTLLPTGQLHTSRVPFDQMTDRLNEEFDRPGLEGHYSKDIAFEAMDICADCGCVYDEDGRCQCASSWEMPGLL